MRCPKCHYISFGSANRCRNCGYEFLLAADAPPADLPIQSDEQDLGPLADFVLSERSPATPTVRPAPTDTPADPPSARRVPVAGVSRMDLPLFGRSSADDAPLVTPPAVPRTPLSVRRAPPPIPRPQPDRSSLLDDASGSLATGADTRYGVTGYPREAPAAPPRPEPLVTASAVARAGAGLIDVVVLGAIDSAVIFSTLRLLEVPLAQIWSLPLVPFAVFLVLLNGGYLAVFTTAGGQTIGKMLTGIRVVADTPDDARAAHVAHSVSLAASVLRATAYLVSLLPAGLGFAAILFDSDGRALHDRLAETRVVKA